MTAAGQTRLWGDVRSMCELPLRVSKMPGVGMTEFVPSSHSETGLRGALSLTMPDFLLLCSHCDETFGGNDNFITPLKLSHDCLDLSP